MIILNDRLMSETLLSDDDNEDDDLNDADVKSLRQRTTGPQQSLSGKRRHTDLLSQEDDSRDSESGVAAKNRSRRAGRVRSRGHSLETIQAIRSHSGITENRFSSAASLAKRIPSHSLTPM